MRRRKGRSRRSSSSSDDEALWADVLPPDKMDTYLDVERCVTLAHSLPDIQRGILQAAAMLQHLMPAQAFRELVQEVQGGGGPGGRQQRLQAPRPDCSLKQFTAWKRRCSDAVNTVAHAVLHGPERVAQLREKLRRRDELDAAAAETERQLAQAVRAWQASVAELQQQQPEPLEQPEQQSYGGQEVSARQLSLGRLAGLTTAAAALGDAGVVLSGAPGSAGGGTDSSAATTTTPAATAAATAAVPAAPAAAVKQKQVKVARAGLTASPGSPAPLQQQQPLPAAAAAAAAVAATPAAKPRKVKAVEAPGAAAAAGSGAAVAAVAAVPASGHQQAAGALGPLSGSKAAAASKQPATAVPVVPKAAAAAAAGTSHARALQLPPPAAAAAAAAGPAAAARPPRSVGWVVIPGRRQAQGFVRCGGAEEADDAALERLEQQEAAEAAAAAARQEQQLERDLQAKGGQLLLPPEGHMAPSNTHRMFRNRMDVVGYLNPDHVDDKAAGLKALMDDQLFRYLDDHEAILMSYQLHNIQTDRAFLHPEPPPLLTVTAVADVVTFEPTPGDIICGVVRKVSHNSISLLVLGCISVAIERPFIPTDWEYDLHSHCWVPGGDYSKAVLKGDLMQCMLLSYPKLDPDQEEVLFNLEGSLLATHTGLCGWQWPRQQRLRQLLAAQQGQGEAYGDAQEAHWQQLQASLRKQGLTRRKLLPVAELLRQRQRLQEDGSSEDEGASSDQEAAQAQQQQKQKHKQKHKKDKQQQQQQLPQQQIPQQQQQVVLGQGSKEAQKAAAAATKAAAKAAKKEAKARAKAEAKAAKKAAKAAEKAAAKEARRAEKAAAKAAAAKRAREEQPNAAAAAGGAAGQQPEQQQPKAKKQKKQEGQQPAVVANGHVPQQQQQEGGGSGSKQKRDKQKSEKGSGSSSKDKKKHNA